MSLSPERECLIITEMQARDAALAALGRRRDDLDATIAELHEIETQVTDHLDARNAGQARARGTDAVTE